MTRLTVSPRAFPSSCRSWCRSCSTPMFSSAKRKTQNIQTTISICVSSNGEERKICGASTPRCAQPRAAYLAVEHLVSRHGVQLHAEKVIPGERNRENEREVWWEWQPANTAPSEGPGWSEGRAQRRASHSTGLTWRPAERSTGVISTPPGRTSIEQY